ncbi:ABC transporter ATP-binding protein [bacterium]|nr:ABC transporter ATP-binding protein [bacterium]
MFLENLNSFLRYFGKGRYLKLVGFAALSLTAGTLESLGVALIYPFVMLIIQPDMVSISKYIPFLKFDNTIASGLFIGFAVLLIFILKNIFIVISQYIQNVFVMNWRLSLMRRFMEYFLYAPYKFTMKSSVNDKLYTLNTLCGSVIDGFVVRILNLMTNIVIISMILVLLLIKFLIPAIITVVFVLTAIIVQNKFFKNRTTKIAKALAEESHEQQKATLENLGNIKEIKILSSENMFYDNYVKMSESLKNVQIISGFYAAIPPYIVEILVVIALLLMAYVIAAMNPDSNSSLVASYAIIVAAIFRIAPALNRIQSSVIAINTSRNFVKMLLDEYKRYDFSVVNRSKPKDDGRLDFRHEITFENVYFSYNERKEVLKNISFKINKGDFVGIIGLSGAGKSTLADVIMGLLPVDSGKILVDGVEVTDKNFYKFRRLIGYVPQQINILDKSIKDNIAWGCEEVDDERVINSLKSAKLWDVINEYPEGIDSNILVGSTGLSQGQKQRLAIARALYREPEILILDEATSALDVHVESEITEMLTDVGKSKTIIAIAHRLSTLKSCNKLIYMKDGVIVDIGTFEELRSRYEDFEELVRLSKID